MPTTSPTEQSSGNTGNQNKEASTVSSAVTTGSGDASKVGGSSAAIGAVLGGVSTVLFLILMGVVMGWVWTLPKEQT